MLAGGLRAPKQAHAARGDEPIDAAVWFARGSRVYVGSTEPPSFFDPLRADYELHFAEDYRSDLANVTNNYALNALETLLFFGSSASVETYSYQSGWFVDACFITHALRGSKALKAAAKAAAAEADRGVTVECRDSQALVVNGVLYGPACVTNPPCGKQVRHAAPARLTHSRQCRRPARTASAVPRLLADGCNGCAPAILPKMAAI